MTLSPWSLAFRIHSCLSKQRVDQCWPHVDFDSGNRWLTRAVIEGGDRVRVELPLNITGLPPAMIAKPEGFSVQLQARDGTRWQADQLTLARTSHMGQEFSLHSIADAVCAREVRYE